MISDRIKELRGRDGISQASLAKKLKVSRSTVNAWEMGISMPTIKHVISMTEIFKVTSDYILELNNRHSINLYGLNQNQIRVVTDLVECFKNGK